jgi:sugar phosphate isomerase/epimerase
MHIGLLTARFKDTSFAAIAKFAGEAGFTAIEAHVRDVVPAEVLKDDGVAVKKTLSETGTQLSAISLFRKYVFGTDDAKVYADELVETVKAAEVLGLDTVCALLGFTAKGKDKLESIRELAPAVFEPAAAEAEKRGVNIALENWFATCLQNLDHFEAVVEYLPERVGFNFDPSHLMWQGIDYLGAVKEFAPRIYHTHAKDTCIDEAALRRKGVLEGRSWWRYVIPGLGGVRWGEYVGALKSSGYDGVLSVEHEDSAFEAEEGFKLALKFLSTLI